MQKFLRRIRGALGMGFTWAAVWGTVGFIGRWVLGINPHMDLPFPLLFGALGFVSGVTFSGLLVVTEGRRRFDQMSLPRFAAWGAAGGLLLSALFLNGTSPSLTELLVIPTTFAVASSICASGSLALARRMVRRDLPSGGGEIADAELTSYQKPELIGRGD